MSRIITAAIALPILIASIYFEWLWPLFVALGATAMVLALYEFWMLAGRRGIKPDYTIGFIGAACLFTGFFFDAPIRSPQLLLVSVVVFVIAVLAAAMLRVAPFEGFIASCGATILGVLYIVFLGGFLISLRMTFEDRPALAAHLLYFFFLIVMGSDAGAYYVGRAFGRHKLAPTISPGKTWEGAIGGMLASLALAALAHYWFAQELSLKAVLPLAAAMSVLGVIGDLTESALKRSAGAKDAAQVLPGHGGLLDRLDSLLFNAPVIYYFAHIYFY